MDRYTVVYLSNLSRKNPAKVAPVMDPAEPPRVTMLEMDLILVPKYLARSIIVGPRRPSSIPEEVRNAENMSNVSVTLIHMVRVSVVT